jgi:hypothetical protein
MRAMKRSPLFRIALLSLAVLSAHTAHAANPHAFVPVRPPCARKVAAAQPDLDKKLTPALKRLIRPGQRVHFHTSFAHPLGFSGAYAPAQAAHASSQLALARQAVYRAPQRRSFALRI